MQRAINARQGLRDLGLGFAYWLGFVVILEPGNLMRWAPPDAAAWAQEIARLLAAGMLGAAATPLILALTRRLPVEGPHAWRRGGLHLAASVAIAVMLVVASCLLAALVMPHEHRPLGRAIAEELQANVLLVAACILGLTAIAHAVGTQARRTAPLPRDTYPETVTSTTRGRLTRIDLADVQWIETQGNYLALHAAGGTRLIRETAIRLSAELDPQRFVRVHRRAIVAIAAVETVTPRPAGDATLRLRSGVELRVSRSCRPQLWAALSEDQAERRP